MKQTILVADSDAALCDFYQWLLTEGGYDVETSWDGLDCLRKLRELTLAALVLDRDLHWGGGAGVLAWLHEESLMPRIPVRFTAAAGNPQAVAELVKPPGVDYLSKPFAMTTLLEKVRAAVEKDGRRERPNLNRVHSEIFIG